MVPELRRHHADQPHLDRHAPAEADAALPHLLAHLNDRRPTRFTVRWGWGNGVFFEEPFGKDFDRNERTDKPPPAKDDKEPRSAVGSASPANGVQLTPSVDSDSWMLTVVPAGVVFCVAKP